MPSSRLRPNGREQSDDSEAARDTPSDRSVSFGRRKKRQGRVPSNLNNDMEDNLPTNGPHVSPRQRRSRRKPRENLRPIDEPCSESTSDIPSSRPRKSRQRSSNEPYRKEKSGKTRSRHLQDYSEEWLSALEKAPRFEDDIEYHYLLISVLRQLNQRFPPAVKPPARTNQPDDADGVPSETPEHARNFFEALEDSSDDDDDAAVPPSAPANGPPKRSKQVRYLLLQAQGGVADCIGKTARKRLVDKAYDEIASLWKEAVEVLESALESAEPFNRILEEANERQKFFSLADGHNYVQLKNVIKGLQIAAEGARKKLDSSVRDMEKQKKRTEEKLDKMLADRDAVRAKLGENWWRNNVPRPDRIDYAAMRDELRKELLQIEDALVDISRHELQEKLEDIVESLTAPTA